MPCALTGGLAPSAPCAKACAAKAGKAADGAWLADGGQGKGWSAVAGFVPNVASRPGGCPPPRFRLRALARSPRPPPLAKARFASHGGGLHNPPSPDSRGLPPKGGRENKETSHFPPPNGGRTKKHARAVALSSAGPPGRLRRRLTRRLCSRKDKGVRPRLGKNV